MREKRVSVLTACVMCLMALAVGVAGSYAAFAWPNRAVQSKLHEIDDITNRVFVGDIDPEKLADYAATGYVAGLDDKWSYYMTAEEYESYHLSSEGKACGIGVSVASGDGQIRVIEVYDDSPAEQAGIVKGDYILGAADKTTEKDGADAVIDAVAGDEGTEVSVTIRKDATGEQKTLTMKRAMVVQRIAWGEMLEDKIGYLRIASFHAGAAEQFKEALDDLVGQGARALVIDVRRNGGGRVTELSEALDPLLPEGTVMTLRTREGKETVYSSDAEMIDLPIAVLIDERSISAGEFFPAALQEYGRATLVGTHTTGKGRAQQTFKLSDGSAVNLSEEEYFTPKGNNLAGKGIAPDIEVELTEEQQKDFYFLKPGEDPQLQKAIEVARAACN